MRHKKRHGQARSTILRSKHCTHFRRNSTPAGWVHSKVARNRVATEAVQACNAASDLDFPTVEAQMARPRSSWLKKGVWHLTPLTPYPPFFHINLKRSGRTSFVIGTVAAWKAKNTSMCGPMESTSTSAWKKIGSASWCWWALQQKELIAVYDGYRGSEQSWEELLLDVQARGLSVDPQLATGDGESCY